MKVKDINECDLVNYKEPAMFIGFPSCTFKCDKECGRQVCQNSDLAKSPNIEISITEIVDRYYSNPITSAVICGGLEPFDSYSDLTELLSLLCAGAATCNKSLPTVVIYTGYTKQEIEDKVAAYKIFVKAGMEIIIKYGRFIPDQESHYDEILRVTLTSPNQYAERLEGIE